MGLNVRSGLQVVGMFILAAGAWAQAPKPSATPAAAQQTAPAQTSSGQAVAAEPVKIPAAELIWSVPLDKSVPAVEVTDGPLSAQRSAVIVGDRVVAIYPIRVETSRGGRPVYTYRMVSLDLATGKVQDEKKLELHSSPYLFATGDDHVLWGRFSLTRLNPDLTESGEKFADPGRGRIACISPDGNTLARWTEGDADSAQGADSRGTQVLSATTLVLENGVIRGAEPSAISGAMVLTDDNHWAQQFPYDAMFVSLVDRGRPHLLYHGDCGGRPTFLTEDKILFLGCGKANVVDRAGRMLKQVALSAPYGRFAGVSRDGSRFALESSQYPPNDPAFNAAEVFTVYDAASYEPVATVQPEALFDGQPWSAFAADGHMFLSGSPSKLSLYRIPF